MILQPGQIWRDVDTGRRLRVLTVDAVGNPTVKTCDEAGRPIEGRRPTRPAYYQFAQSPGTKSGARFLFCGVAQ